MNAPTNHSESMALAASQSYAPATLAAGATSAAALMLDDRALDKIMRIADMMASGRCTIPQHLQKSPGDCLAVAMQAVQWNMNPFAVAQKTHVSQSGALGYEAQLISAVVTGSGAVEGDPEYEFLGNWDKVLGKVEERKSEKGGKYYVATYTKADEAGLGVICRLRLRGESAPREMPVMMSQCYPRFSTQWATDPKQQICYVAIRKWARLHKPGLILGIYSPEELSDRPPINMGAAQVVEPQPTGPAPAAEDDPLVVNAYAAAKKGKAAFAQFFNSTPKDDRPKLRAYRAELDAIAAEADAARTVDTAPPFPPADAPVAAQAPGKSFDEVMAMICKAKTEDELMVAGDWLDSITDPAQREMLEAKFDEQMGNVRGAA